MNHRKTSSCPQKTLYSSDWTWHNKLVLHSLDSEIFQRLPFVNLCQHICEKAVASCANEGKARSAVCTVRTSRVCGHAFCSFHPMTLLPGSPRCEFCLWARLQHDFTQGLKYVLPNSANLQMLQNFGEKKTIETAICWTGFVYSCHILSSCHIICRAWPLRPWRALSMGNTWTCLSVGPLTATNTRSHSLHSSDGMQNIAILGSLNNIE